MNSLFASKPNRIQQEDSLTSDYKNNFFPYMGNITSYLPKSCQATVGGQGISNIDYNNLVGSESIQNCLQNVTLKNFWQFDEASPFDKTRKPSHEAIIQFLQTYSNEIMSKFLKPDIKLLDKEKEYLLISKKSKEMEKYADLTDIKSPIGFVLAKINDKQNRTIKIHCYPFNGTDSLIKDGRGNSLVVKKHPINNREIFIAAPVEDKLQNNTEKTFIFFIKNNQPELVRDKSTTPPRDTVNNVDMCYKIEITLIDGLRFKDIGNGAIIPFINTIYSNYYNQKYTYYKHFLYEPDENCINDIKKNVYGITTFSNGGGKRTNKTSKKHRKQTLKNKNKKSRKNK